MVKKNKNIPRPYNAGTMTAAEKHSMIINALRKLSSWWKPLTRTKARARVWRGIYRCEKCWKEGKEYSPPPRGKKRRVKNFHVDHKKPVVPITGFSSYDEWIERCFIEEGEGLRVLCSECHSEKTKKENAERKKFKENNK